MHSTVKVLCILFLLYSVQNVENLPQFSIPFVSWNNNRNEPLRNPINVRVPNLFSGYGRNNNPKQYENTKTYNEVLNNDKIITVTPHAAYYDKFPVTAQPNSINLGTYKDPKWGISQGSTVRATTFLPNVWDLNSKHSTFQGQDKDKPTDKPKEGNLTNAKKSEEKPKNEFEISEEDINRIFKYNEITTDSSDYTTESTTEYESTTEDLSGLNRSGVSGHVVASLLG